MCSVERMPNKEMLTLRKLKRVISLRIGQKDRIGQKYTAWTR